MGRFLVLLVVTASIWVYVDAASMRLRRPLGAAALRFCTACGIRSSDASRYCQGCGREDHP